VVTGRTTEVSGGRARVELGEGIQAVCRLTAESSEKEEKPADPKTDLSSLKSMLEARWKGGQATGAPRPSRCAPVRSAASALSSWTRRPKRSNWNWRS